MQLGVNGYSFIVDNNGRVLYHPDLRPLVSSGKFEQTIRHLKRNSFRNDFRDLTHRFVSFYRRSRET